MSRKKRKPSSESEQVRAIGQEVRKQAEESAVQTLEEHVEQVINRTPTGLPASINKNSAPQCNRCLSDDTVIYAGNSDTIFYTSYWRCRHCGETGKVVRKNQPDPIDIARD